MPVKQKQPMQGVCEELVRLQGSRLHTAPSLVIPEKSAFLSPRWNSKSNYLILPSCRSPTWSRRAEIGLLHSSCSLLEQFGAEQRGRSAEAGDQSSWRRRGEEEEKVKEKQHQSSRRTSGRKTKFFLLQGQNISLKYPPRTAH